METESSHSNQYSYLTGTKKKNIFFFFFFVEANARNMYAKYQLHKHGGNTIGTTCVVDRDDTAYMVVDREFRLPTE